MKKLTKTDVKHKKFARHFVDTADASLAYKKVYKKVTPGSAKRLSKELLKRPEVQEDIRQLLNYQGLTLKKLNTELLDIIDRPYKETLNKDGDTVTLTDKNLKLGALIQGYKLHGVSGEHSSYQDNRQVIFNAGGLPVEEVQKKLISIADTLERLRNQPKIVEGEIIDLPEHSA